MVINATIISMHGNHICGIVCTLLILNQNMHRLCIKGSQTFWESNFIVALMAAMLTREKLPGYGKNGPFLKIPRSNLDIIRNLPLFYTQKLPYNCARQTQLFDILSGLFS